MKAILSIIVFTFTCMSICGQKIKMPTIDDDFMKKSVEEAAKQEPIESDYMKRNSKCLFGIDRSGIYSMQNRDNNYVVYEIPYKSASELKSATISAISSLFKSPKDVLTNLGDNIIQLERYASRVYMEKMGDYYYNHDIMYSLIIQFKDGKIRYNTPSIKQIYVTEVPMLGTLKLDMSKPLYQLIKESYNMSYVADEFNMVIKKINQEVLKDDNW